jgi:hypothetical protein
VEPELRRLLQAKLNTYNVATVGLPPLESAPPMLTVHDAGHQVVGGLMALTFWQWLRIDLLLL